MSLKTSTVELCIGFERDQLRVVTEAPELLELLLRNFAEMIAPCAVPDAAVMRVRRSVAGYECVRGTTSLTLVKPESVVAYIRQETMHYFIRQRPDLLWLHAGAVARNGVAILFPGSQGSGKSGLVTELCSRGWDFVSDDVVPMLPRSQEIIPYLRMPQRRIFPGRRVQANEMDRIQRETLHTDLFELSRSVTRIRAIVFPTFNDAMPVLTRRKAAGAALELMRHCMNFVDHKVRAVACAAELAQAVPCYDLSFAKAREAVSLIEEPALASY